MYAVEIINKWQSELCRRVKTVYYNADGASSAAGSLSSLKCLTSKQEHPSGDKSFANIFQSNLPTRDLLF